MKRFALLPFAVAALIVGCSEDNLVGSDTTKKLSTADSLKLHADSIAKLGQSLVTLIPTTEAQCSTTVSTAKTLTISFVSAKPIASTAFAVTVFDSTGKVSVPATEILATVSSFTAISAGSATVSLTPTATAKKANYSVRVIAIEGTSADTVDYKLFVKDGNDEQIADKGIVKQAISLYNVLGGGKASLDAVKGEGVSSKGISNIGKPQYLPADSARVDFRTVNTVERAINSYLTTTITSCNNTTFAAVDSATFVDVTKSVKLFSTKLMSIADKATETKIAYTSSAPYFVAKLGGGRGYVLAKVAIDTAFSDATTGSINVGKADLEYYYISSTDVVK